MSEIAFKKRNGGVWKSSELKKTNVTYQVYCKCGMIYAGKTTVASKSTSTVLRRWNSHVNNMKSGTSSFGAHTNDKHPDMVDASKQKLADLFGWEIEQEFDPNYKTYEEMNKITAREQSLLDAIPAGKKINKRRACNPVKCPQRTS